MKLKEILADLSKVEKSTVVSISPGPAVISAGSSDGMAAKLLLWLYEQLPEDATAQDLHDVLDAAKWWTTFLESVHYAETHLTPHALDGVVCTCKTPHMQLFKFGWLCVECGKLPRK